MYQAEGNLLCRTGVKNESISNVFREPMQSRLDPSMPEHEYATAADILTFIKSRNILHDNTQLGLEDIASLLEALRHDGRIEPVHPVYHHGIPMMSYRECTWQIAGEAGNALTDIPCGRCPVFEMCGDVGPITPSKCEYLKKWMEF